MQCADKGDVATHEGALDHKTRLALFKMINSGVLSKVYGIISTGKEANVFHARGGPCVGGGA
jgi:RIO kinase 1